ncbi:DNA polymerase I A, chloroplastic/mitochondrial [Linum perenne]
MGISFTAHIYTFRPLPVSPSYLRFYRPCPCLSAASTSSSPPPAIRVAAAAYTIPFSRHRFWGQHPSGVVVNLRRRDDKRYLGSGNYSTSTYLDTTTTYNESRMQWTKESICVRESRSRVTQDNSAHLQDGGSCSLNHAEFLKMRVEAKVESRKSENGAIIGENRSGITNGRSKDFSLLTPEERVRTSSSFSGQPKSSFGNVGVGFACGREYDLPMMLETEVKCNGSTNGVTVAADGSAVTNRRPNVFSSLVLEERARMNDSLKMSMNGSAIASKKTNGLSSVAVSKSFKPLAHDANRSATQRLDSSTSNTVQEIAKPNGSLPSEVVRHPEGSNFVEIKSKGSSYTPNGKVAAVADTAEPANAKEFQTDIRNRLISISNNVLVVDNVSTAKAVVSKLTHQYKHHVHACDTESLLVPLGGRLIVFIGVGIWWKLKRNYDCVLFLLCFVAHFSCKVSNIDLKVQTPIDHGELICFSIYSGPEADYGNGKSWDERVMSGAKTCYKELIGKVSMKTIFVKNKLKKDGSEGKTTIMASVEELQREDRECWICYSALDAISTLQLYESLKKQLMQREWKCYVIPFTSRKSMFDFYQEYWRPFGELLVKMEDEGMLVDRAYLSEIEKVAKTEQEIAGKRFRHWASKYCTDAQYMNIGSDEQLRQLFYGGTAKRNDFSVTLPESKLFPVLNVDKVIAKGKKKATKKREIKLHKIVANDLPTERFTPSGWPSMSDDALKAMAGKVSADSYFMDDFVDPQLDEDANSNSDLTEDSQIVSTPLTDVDTSAYGTALKAFSTKEEGIDACHAIASLYEARSIDSLISSCILPLQNQPALEKDRYKIRQAFIATPGNSLIVADYGQLELRILAHLAGCESMLRAFEAGGDFHSRTAMNMYPHILEAIERKEVLLEWYSQPGEEKPPVPLLKDRFASERRKAKMLNFSIAYGKTPAGLADDWNVSKEEAKETVNLWYKERQEVLKWQEARKQEANRTGCVHTLLGRARHFPSMKHMSRAQRNHIERAAINTPVQVHDELILEGPKESAEEAKALVVECMSKPFGGKNVLKTKPSLTTGSDSASLRIGSTTRRSLVVPQVLRMILSGYMKRLDSVRTYESNSSLESWIDEDRGLGRKTIWKSRFEDEDIWVGAHPSLQRSSSLSGNQGIIRATTRDYKGTKKIWSAKGGGNRTVQTEKEDPILSPEQRMTNEVTQVTTPLGFVEAEEEQAIDLESDVPENSKMSKTLKRRLERKKKKSAQKELTDSLNNVVNPASDGDHLTNDTRLPSETVDTKGSGTEIESQPTEDTLLPDTLPHAFVELLKKALEDSLVEKEVMHHGSMECVIRKWTSEDECDAVEGKTASGSPVESTGLCRNMNLGSVSPLD